MKIYYEVIAENYEENFSQVAFQTDDIEKAIKAEKEMLNAIKTLSNDYMVFDVPYSIVIEVRHN